MQSEGIHYFTNCVWLLKNNRELKAIKMYYERNCLKHWHSQGFQLALTTEEMCSEKLASFHERRSK